MGDPAGIAGEITAGAWRALRHSGPAFTLVGDPGGIAVPMRAVRTLHEGTAMFGDALPILSLPLAAPVVPGTPDPRHGPAIIASIERAVRLALDGEASGIVTNPISKANLYACGFAYPGHTEFLAALTGAPLPVMMLANDRLRVVPVTIHVSLRVALATLTTEGIVATSRITAAALVRQFGLSRPRLAIAGLNPHAGEGGAMGDEEQTLIAPAIARLRAEGIDVAGPYPPDTMFTEAARSNYDAAICMYHDQALIPLKTIDMSSGVNITLGLPIVRTSPDHGTAFDIAGRGKADPASLIAAIRLAGKLS